jgi:hypothetical protein
MAWTDYTPPDELTSPMSDAQYQALAMDECNLNIEVSIAASCTANLPLWWSMYIPKGQVIAYWYLRRAICMYIIGQYRKMRDIKLGTDTFKNSDVMKNTQDMLVMIQAEIDRLDPESQSYVDSYFPDTRERLMDSTMEEELRVELGYVADFPIIYRP